MLYNQLVCYIAHSNLPDDCNASTSLTNLKLEQPSIISFYGHVMNKNVDSREYIVDVFFLSRAAASQSESPVITGIGLSGPGDEKKNPRQRGFKSVRAF